MGRMTAGLVASIALCMAGGAGGALAQTYGVTDLGNFFATGVNDSGWVMGTTAAR